MLHVKSHDGLERPEQRGNDKADKIAKKLMNQAETLEPLPYFITAEEKFLAFHKDTLITDNIRTWLKEQELTQLQNAWRKLKVQGRLFRRFPQQILTLTKLIKNWSIERAEGKAWIFSFSRYVTGSRSIIESTHIATTHQKHYAASVKATHPRPQSIYSLARLLGKNITL